MGKASRWFRALLGLKKSDNLRPQPTAAARPKDKRRWSFVKSYREKDNHTHSQHLSRVVNDRSEDDDPNKHAIAVAAATAAVAEAAAAAAHAAAEVVRLTSSSGRCVANNTPVAYVSENGNSRHCWRQDLAAIKIQSAFRGYLARRALRALKALVRLQALVRGHIQRKRWLQRLQSLAKAQARARPVRKHISDSSQSSSKSSYYHHPGPPTPEKFEHGIRSRSGKFEQSSVLKNLQRIGPRTNAKAVSDEEEAHLHSNWYEHRMDERSWEQKTPVARNGFHDDDKGDKILEVDTGKPHFTTKRRNLFHSLDHYGHSFTNSKDSTNQTIQSLSSSEVQSLTPLKYHRDEEEVFCTAENSPQFYSASSKGGGGRRGPFTPSRSDCSASLLSDYSGYHPNYMSYTESSRAKVRSISAPRQRVQYERSSSTKRYSIHGVGELRSSGSQRASALQASFTSKVYPGSGRLDRLGMPIGQGY